MNPSELIDKQIAEVKDWRGARLAHLRTLIVEADPAIQEEWKWDSPVFVHNGMVCSIGAFKNHVKVNFFQGAALADPKGLFNAGLEAKKTRSIDLREGDEVDEAALRELIQSAAALNTKGKK